MTIEKADELVTLVCDHLCHHPFVMTQEELDEKCESCPLAAHLMKDVQESPALIVPALSEEELAKFREAVTYGSIMASGEEPSIEFVQQGWIPVTEQMPETSDTVAVLAKGNVKMLARWDGISWMFDAYYEGWRRPITHWMPFPEAPKEEHHE